MMDFMKKIPGGLLLVPMLISAIIYTLAPNLFMIGGMTQALLTKDGLTYIIAFTCFCSGAVIDLKTLGQVFKRTGLLALVKTAIVVGFGFLYFKFFGLDGILGLSTLAIIVGLASTNPSLYLALEGEYGSAVDQAGFGILAIMCTPAYPLLLFGLIQSSPINWMNIISTLIPLVLGLILGNIDKKFGEFMKPGLALSLPLMGWSFGYGINIIEAAKSGFTGILLAMVFYIVLLPISFIFERKVLKLSGKNSIAMNSIAGMSVSIPSIIAATNPSLEIYKANATAAIAFGVVITSIVTPILVKKVYEMNNKK
ncbi:2-keto-3-deoxygluconate permease [Anaerococcus sp. NML200537]|uniref:2-keto-3-deoxygluconate permease n=1 Tax=Anaerococcus sp. NML200537 TaxID=2954485 RepID=UPI0022381CC1|nr:2-keto-3-deoxygluconate permease [Anaerococcus sp. NML200537]MCW6700985.1 2-keto-3-deoxygluconate permease [Anaerococcus sp. NML200537]